VKLDLQREENKTLGLEAEKAIQARIENLLNLATIK
tara:strand:+ start:666 stop:773 length:108 start_codon:yes stop_codon:yes gene_type:complete